MLVRAEVRRPASQQVEKDRADSIEIGTGVYRTAIELLRRHVLRRPEQLTVRGDRPDANGP
jgi:hypothetical protein